MNKEIDIEKVNLLFPPDLHINSLQALPRFEKNDDVLTRKVLFEKTQKQKRIFEINLEMANDTSDLIASMMIVFKAAMMNASDISRSFFNVNTELSADIVLPNQSFSHPKEENV